MVFPQMLHGTGIFSYMWLEFMVNVGKCSIHGAVGSTLKILKTNPKRREKNELHNDSCRRQPTAIFLEVKLYLIHHPKIETEI